MIELASTVLLLASAFSPEKVTAETVSTSTNAVAVTEEASDLEHPPTISEYVSQYFKDTPVLKEIAQCESSTRQYDEKGNVLRGRVNKGDVGLMQINLYYHGDKAIELGYDIYTVDGNLGFAKWLYEKYGDKPWVHSSKCWKPRMAAINASKVALTEKK